MDLLPWVGPALELKQCSMGYRHVIRYSPKGAVMEEYVGNCGNTENEVPNQRNYSTQTFKDE